MKAELDILEDKALLTDYFRWLFEINKRKE